MEEDTTGTMKGTESDRRLPFNQEETQSALPFAKDETDHYQTNLDEASDSTFSDDDDDGAEDDDEDDNDPTLTLMERRAFNIERNHKWLSSFDTVKGRSSTKTTPKTKSNTPRRYDDVDPVVADTDDTTLLQHHRRGGMILRPTTASFSPPTVDHHRSLATTTQRISLQQLQQRYPHRSVQIRKLYSILSVPIHVHPVSPQSPTTTTSFISPPIIVTGPAGCGKTSIVRDVVTQICQTTAALSSVRPVALAAYINCTTLDHITMEDFISNAYSQWFQQVQQRYPTPYHRHNHHRHRSPTKLKKRPRVATVASTDNRTNMNDIPRLSRRRPAKATRLAPPPLTTAMTRPRGMDPHHQTSSSVLTMIWSFGRSIQRLVDRIRRDHHHEKSVPLILIVDHAEVLLCMGTTYSRSTHSDRINLLVQLMLLPRTLGLNLTLIFISRNILLEHSALNHMSSQGTIQGHLCPITIHFPAYRKKSTFQTILLQSNMKTSIAGNESPMALTNFHNTVYHSFLETLVQGLSDFTSDLKEYLRLGRGLWPLYISPLLPENIATTIAFVRKDKKSTQWNAAEMERDILPLLDQRFFPHLRHALEYGFGVLSFDSSGTVTTTNRNNHVDDHDLPILVKYLLLAVFICHTNRQDKDRQLFSIERNGRKRRKAKEADHEEEMAYGTTGSQQDAPRTIRPRTFPMERLYSLYVSIVSLNASKSQSDPHRSSGSDCFAICNDEMVRSLGNIRFLETIMYLRDIGVLHEFPKRSINEPIRFSQRNLWTSLSKDEAQAIARSINFPLDRYIL